MAVHNKTLQLIASKLGLAQEEKVLNKAAEFERLLQTKSTAGSYMTDTGKVVICLDLAAACFGCSFDLKMAVKYSGLKLPTYTSCKKTVQNLLEINSNPLSIAQLCLALQCTTVQSLAEKLLDLYQQRARMQIDTNLPHYVCIAVYQACRLKHVKVSKNKIIEKSRLKPAQWAKLDTEWTKFADGCFAPEKPMECEENSDNMDTEELSEKEKSTSEPQIESYEHWKRRMLEAAYKNLKELRALENRSKESNTPRRSPRKNSQISYKSPTISKTVRLLFPTELN